MNTIMGVTANIKAMGAGIINKILKVGEGAILNPLHSKSLAHQGEVRHLTGLPFLNIHITLSSLRSIAHIIAGPNHLYLKFLKRSKKASPTFCY